jgi:hypothetical protein
MKQNKKLLYRLKCYNKFSKRKINFIKLTCIFLNPSRVGTHKEEVVEEGMTALSVLFPNYEEQRYMLTFKVINIIWIKMHL